MSTAPAARSRVTARAVNVAGGGSRCTPKDSGHPATAMLSLTLNGTPASRPVARAASMRERSGLWTMTALSWRVSSIRCSASSMACMRRP